MYTPLVAVIPLLNLLLQPATADPICSPIFGQPSYNDCEALAVELFSNWPGETHQPLPDRVKHVFSLPGAAIPAHSSYRSVQLPKFAGHAQEPECLMSLMPMRKANGEVAVEVGYYHPMSKPAQRMNLECVRGKQQGGFTHVGPHGNLILAFYAPDSPFDNAVAQWRQGVPLTCQGKAEAQDIATGHSGSVDAGSCTDTEDEFWDSLSDIEELRDFPQLRGFNISGLSTYRGRARDAQIL